MHRSVLGVGILGAMTAGGTLFAFSSFVMRALGQLPDEYGVAAMQQINRAAPTATFMVPLFGTTVIGLGLGLHAIGDLDERGAPLELVGAAAYLVGSLITVAYHVPRNERLGRLDPASPEAARMWAAYRPAWTRMNHVRTMSSVTAAGVWLVALAQRSVS